MRIYLGAFVALAALALVSDLRADSVNSPNITLNVDTNRSAGPGAGNVAVTVNTITIAETTLAEYSSGSGKSIVVRAKSGYQFDSSSAVTAVSTTIGINGLAVNTAASLTPSGSANETLTFNLTSGTSATVQDIVRINGVKIKILSAAGAAGPAQTTLSLVTSAAGGAFSDQGIVAASITRGAADRLIFAAQPGSNQAGADLLPAVKMVDFGGNIVISDSRTIFLSISTNPGSATLLGTVLRDTASGIATWVGGDDLNITTAANGYVLQATHNGSSFLSSDSVTSGSFDISAGAPGGLSLSAQPSSTAAGGDILLTAQTVDGFGNPTTSNGIEVTLDSAVNPGGWPLLVDTSLTKSTVSGVAAWSSDDHLRILKAVSGYQLSVSGLGAPVVTSSFDITPASASLVRFVTQPSDVLQNKIMSPAPSAEIIDIFGNRVSSSAVVNLGLRVARCGGSLSGRSGTAAAGLATYDSLKLDKACRGDVLKATSSGLIGATSDSFTVHAKDEVPVSIASTELTRNSFKFSASGSFSPPKKSLDSPTVNGGVLTVTGETGAVRYSLPASGWSNLGSKGFKFVGSKCKSVVVSKTAVSALCRGKTGTLSLPETEVEVLLELGKGTASFCGTCGGTASGDPSSVFKRTSCSKPTFCP